MSQYRRVTVPLTGFKEEILRRRENGDTWSSIANQLGWKVQRPYGIQHDTTRVQRAFGIIPEKCKDGKYRKRTKCLKETAEFYLDKLGLDPIDVGL